MINHLIRELFLIDYYRKNFNLTRAVSGITKVFPDRRVETLMKFRRRLAETPEVIILNK
jgi:aubergine-like protein